MIYILDENLKKLDTLKKYDFSQYVLKSRDIGTFTINVPMIEENRHLSDREKQYYFLFDDSVVGKVMDVKYDSNGEFNRTIVLSGELAEFILKKRVIAGTIEYKGLTCDYIKTLVQEEITKDPNSKRYINITVEFENEEYLRSVCMTITRQVTGGYIWDEISAVLAQDELGIKFVPVVKPTHVVNGVETNISEWKLIITAGEDRRKGNAQGNEAVVFSQSMSNISGTSYDNNTSSYCDVAYVAGEGEAEARKWYEVDATENNSKKGWNRSELWVDARDVQSEAEDGTILTEEQYEELIKERANEKFTENNVQESYSATVASVNREHYTYGVDYKINDRVTVIDDELKIAVGAQVTEVTISEQDNRKIIDAAFTYGAVEKRPEDVIKEPSNDSKQNTVNIKYLENKIKKIENITNNANNLASWVDRMGKGVVGTITSVDDFVKRCFVASSNGAYPVVPFRCNFSVDASPTGVGAWNKGIVVLQNANYTYGDIGVAYVSTVTATYVAFLKCTAGQSTGAYWQRMGVDITYANLSQYLYTPGTTVDLPFASAGYVTSAGRDYNVSFCASKPIASDVTSMSVDRATATIRQNNRYLIGNANSQADITGLIIREEATLLGELRRGNAILIFRKTPAPSGVENNSAFGCIGSIRVTFR